MKMKKKLVMAAVITTLTLSGVLTACGKKNAGNDASTAETSSAAQTEAAGNMESGTENETDMQPTAEAGADSDAAGEAITEAGGVFGTFTALTLDGKEINQDIFAQADLTMVNIWGTFCGPCIREMPDLGEISREYADKGFQMVGIVSDITEANDAGALDIVEKTKADYTHIVLSEDLYNNYVAGVSVVPTTVFVDKEGKQVGSVYAGSKSKAKWESIIDEMLGNVQQ